MKRWQWVLIVMGGGMAIAIGIFTLVYVESLWFAELHLLAVFLKRLAWKLSIAAIFAALSWGFMSYQLRVAQRLAYDSSVQEETVQIPRSRYLPLPVPARLRGPHSTPLTLPILLPLILVVLFVLVAMGLYYLWATLQVWTPDYTLPNITPAIPQPFYLPWIFSKLKSFRNQIIFGVLVLGVVISSWWRWRGSLQMWITLMSGVWGLLLAGNWTRFLLFLNTKPFTGNDPQFGLNLGFYLFQLPVWQLLEAWLRGLFLLTFLITLLTFLQSGNSLSEGKFIGFSPSQLRHLSRLGAAVAAGLGFAHWINRYRYLFINREVVYGANYTDVHWRLPVETALVIFTGAIAIWLMWLGWKGWRTQAVMGVNQPGRRLYLVALWLPLSVYFLLLFIQSFVGVGIELLSVQPNQLTRERPYIARNIEATRQGFNLSVIQPATLSGTGVLDRQDLEANRPTIENIRLWDPLPLLRTNRQLQQIRLYYSFLDADLDRYTIRVRAEDGQKNTAKQQVLIAPRELDYTAVPEDAKTWVNQHLVYTHGYGFTLSPVNLVDQGGLPFYFVKDIGTDAQEDALRTSSELIRTSIPIGKPRIYFGELTKNYIMTNTKVREFDFPSGDENVYNVYDGRGGIAIDTPWKRLLFALYLRDWQMLFTRNFTADTQVLFRRNINHRIRHIAPFLRFDRNPYLVTADTDDQGDSTLYWLIDAYTTSAFYPYSDPGDRPFNYIRNSVKVLVDAYNGDVQIFTVDEQDPLIQSWKQIFPELFKPLSMMPTTLKSHIRYPEDLFSTQSERLLTYHMEDIDVFYNREDQWQIPREIYGDEQQPIAPYYLIMKLAGINATEEEFVLSQVYTPNSRNNLIAILFARCDEQNYGKLLLYTLPKERLVYGPEQIEALINQDPIISERISLWNRKGSSVIQGNLLVIPIKESLLYVEPIYLEAEKNSLPTLARVIVVYNNQIAMSETLEGALDAIFAPDKSDAAEAIVREVDVNQAELN